MEISDVADVNVAIAAAFIATQDFGTPLVAAHHTRYPDRVRAYSASSWDRQMIAEGFTTTSRAYKGLGAAFRQTPRPATVKLGRLSAAETQTIRLIPVVQNGLYRHALTIENEAGVKETASYIEDGTPTLAEICTGLAAAINALTAAIAVTATGSSGTHVDVTADSADALFAFRDLTASLTLRDITAAPVGLEADLIAIKAADDEWYGLGLTTPAPASIEIAADWIEANAPHVFSASSHDMGIITDAEDDIASSIMAQGYERTLVAYHSKALQHHGLAWMASMLTYEPGQVDWSAKTVEGSEPDNLTPSQEGFAAAKNASTYGLLAKAPWTGTAKTGSGFFVDLIQLKDWTKARLQEFIVRKRKALPKVKYTDGGVGALTLEAMMEVVAQGQQNDAIDTDPTTVVYTVPKVAEQTAANKAARRFVGSNLSFRASNSAHQISIDVNIAL